ncbi:MAG: hypothetical protein B6I19_07100 [Bacteroidetes bacterium 4572_114]|nr:MAG: hypothetical protein B6I19_07100 [Bacteroidetes bacterium 4572_114]
MNEFLASNDFTLLLRLLIAHLLGDFLFQRKSWIVERQKSHWKAGSLYLHVFIIGLLTYLFSGHYNNFWLPLSLMLSHFLTDLWKSYRTDNILTFMLDQSIHLVVIIFAWYFYVSPEINFTSILLGILDNQKYLIVIIAYIFIIWPSGYMIAKFTKPWQSQLGTTKGLTDAGRWIGIFERILILTFVLLNQFTGIGFLIAAKSILRFGDINNPDNRKEAEFILLGTMVSFILAIFIGFVAMRLIRT